MPVLELHLATIHADGSLSLFDDQLITARGMDRIDAILYYKRSNPTVEVLTSRWLTVDELSPNLPQFAAPVAPPAAPAPAPNPRPVWPGLRQLLRNVWPLTLALGGLLLINAVATVEHVRGDIERTAMEAHR
jgi:hypothetical protein